MYIKHVENILCAVMFKKCYKFQFIGSGRKHEVNQGKLAGGNLYVYVS